VGPILDGRLRRETYGDVVAKRFDTGSTNVVGSNSLQQSMFDEHEGEEGGGNTGWEIASRSICL
jgi:hypothetical protein